MGRARALLALTLFVTVGAAAQQPDQRAYLDLFVNDAQKDTVMVRLRGDEPIEDALVSISDLEKAGLHGLGGTREQHDGQDFVSLRSLAPEVRFTVDPQALAVRLVAAPALLETQRLDMSPLQRPAEMVFRRDTSAFLNYSATAESGGTYSGAGELGVSVAGNLAFTGVSVLPSGQVVRGLSSVTVDDLSGLRRLTFGDAPVASSAVGGGTLVAGVSLTREFSLDPYFIRQPLPRLSGAILTPSTMDVYVNGMLVRQQPLAPGQFEVRNLPVPSGAGQIDYVVRDAFGRTQAFASPYYASAGVLAAGITEYGYQIGMRRQNLGTDSFGYDWPMLVARHRIGIGDWLTAGYRLEAASRSGGLSLLASGGPSFAIALPLGELDIEGALSADGSAGGAAASIAYTIYTRRLSAGASVRAMTRSFSNLALASAADRPQLQLLGSVGAPVSPVLSLTLEGQLSSMRDAGLSSLVSARADLRITKRLSFLLGTSRTREPGTGGQYAVFGTLLYNFGDGTTADMAANTGGGTGGSLGAQRSLPLGEGFGWQLRSAVADGAPASGLGVVQYQGPYGTYLASYNRTGTSDGGLATAAGSLVMVDGNLMASRPVQEGFALIQVPGVPGVRGFLNSQEIGRTDWRGNLLVPALQPYYGNHLSIGHADIPIDYEVGRVDQIVATSLRAGALVKFDVQKIQNVSGLVRVDDAIPAYGEMLVDDKLRSPLGRNGEFWFENLPAGRHDARVEYAEGRCRFVLDVPNETKGNIRLGQLHCRRPEKVAAAQ